MGPNGVPEKRAKIIFEKISFCSFYIKSVQKLIGSLFIFTKLSRIKGWEQFFYLSCFLDLLHIQKRAFHTNTNVVGVKHFFLDVRSIQKAT